MVKLTCYCCGFEKEFSDGDEAFRAGWDGPPHFTQVECCDLCPTVFAIYGIPEQHLRAHEKWKLEGRPGNFEASYAQGDVPRSTVLDTLLDTLW
jgi:hypothetical protein